VGAQLPVQDVPGVEGERRAATFPVRPVVSVERDAAGVTLDVLQTEVGQLRRTRREGLDELPVLTAQVPQRAAPPTRFRNVVVATGRTVSRGSHEGERVARPSRNITSGLTRDT